MRALLVDLGNVLVRFDHGITLAAIARASGLSSAVLKPHLYGGLEKDFDLGRLSAEGYFRAAERRAGIGPIPDDVWVPAWRDIFTPIAESLALLDRLAPDVRSCIVSNTNRLHWDGVRRVCDVERRVDATALSFEVASVKPEETIFRCALERLGASAQDAVFADDRPELVEAARRFGLDGFVVDTPVALERELASRGFLVR